MDEHSIVDSMPQMFRQLAECSPAGVCVVTGDEFRIRWANPVYRKFFGSAWQQGQVAGRLLADLLPQFESDGLGKIFREVAGNAGGSAVLEYRHQDAESGVSHWRWFLTALPAAHGATADLMVHAFDITCLVTARESIAAMSQSLEQERQLYQSMMSNTPDFNYLLDRQGQFLYANEALLNFLSLDSDIIGKTFHDIGYPQGLARRMENALSEVVQSQRQVRLETAFAPPNGEYGIHECIFTPVLDAHGKVSSIAGSTRNITERKDSEQQLRASEEKFKVLANTIPQLAWVATPEGWISWYNDRWYAYTGTTLEDGIGWGWQKVHDPEHLPEVLAKWKTSLETGEPFELTFPLKGADGKFRPFLTKSVPLKNELGQILSWFGTNTDISEQQRVAEERLQVQLMQALSQRLLEVQEDERKQLGRELHDKVGQNLTALNINFDIMLAQMSEESRSKLGERMDDSIHLVEETAAAIENILIELRPPMLDDYGLIAALRWYATLFQKRFGVAVKVTGPEAPLRVSSSHEAALFRIAQEALNNIAKHAHAQNAVISLWLKGSEASLSISDDGVGFAKNLLKHPSKQSRRGVLTMQERALAVGGRFSIKSAPQKGTQVIVKVVLDEEEKLK